jgi:hypothetical protein
MADRDSLRFVGFIFATITVVVMLTTGMVVKGYADGAYSLETSAVADQQNPHSGRRSPQRSQIGLVRANALHEDIPRVMGPARGPPRPDSMVAVIPEWSRDQTSDAQLPIGESLDSGFTAPRCPRNDEGQQLSRQQEKTNQPWRRPSAASFHCVTLSAIMRVDFIAAWLSLA